MKARVIVDHEGSGDGHRALRRAIERRGASTNGRDHAAAAAIQQAAGHGDATQQINDAIRAAGENLAPAIAKLP